MTKPIVSIMIAVLIFQFLLIAPTFAQSSNGAAETAKVKAALIKIGASEKSKVKIKLRDGRKINGYIAELNAADYIVADSKTKNRTTIAYTETIQVKKSGLSLGAKIGIGALVVAGVAAVVIALGVKNLDDDIFPK